METKRIKISKKKYVKGEDGYKIFSIRVKEETVASLDKIAKESNRSRNELINLFLEHEVLNHEIVD